MKISCTIFTLLICVSTIYSQKVKSINGPIFNQFGSTYNIENPDLNLNTDEVYKVIFDVYSDVEDITKINPHINTLARFINMHAQHGIDPKNLNLVLVLHGAATKNVLNNSAFKNHYDIDNPNAALIDELYKNNVKIYVCGQSLTYKGFEKKEILNSAQMSLSALTALVYYQKLGYQLITFN